MKEEKEILALLKGKERRANKIIRRYGFFDKHLVIYHTDQRLWSIRDLSIDGTKGIHGVFEVKGRWEALKEQLLKTTKETP
ncbi:hypothetical protein [Flavobacterium sp.]|jgi:hypothetical protein|uniref:hypothetical protein n=1 Tax=Flavobacterium sp. TaxID=239 RepID=UPI0037C14F43